MEVDPKDVDALIREKYEGDPDADLTEELRRLQGGEPLAYVIGHIPFLGLSIDLASRPLIPRPETEWWTEKLAAHIGTKDIRVLDLCAGSGAIGLALLKHCPNARVSFGELVLEHARTIRKNLERNGLDSSRADIRTGNLFEPFEGERFDLIATNPPYIPETRPLPESVSTFEPSEALYSGGDGLGVISSITKEAKEHLLPSGEVWMECDIENIEEAAKLLAESGALRTEIQNDQYERPRFVVAFYP